MAVADAYGVGFENAPDDLVAKHNDLKYHVLSKHVKTIGRYTDDTQMSIAVSEAIMTGDWFDQRNYAKHFVEAYQRDPHRGYARGFGKLLSKVKDGDDLLKRIVPSSDRGGAAMRAVPLGLLPTLKYVQLACTLQASITHRSVGGVTSALAVATAAHLVAKKRIKPKSLIKAVEKTVPGNWGGWKGRTSLRGDEIVRAALTILESTDSMREILHESVALGGDTDTVASIAVGIAALSDSVKNDLPKDLIKGLERGKFGVDYLKKQDRRLRAKFLK